MTKVPSLGYERVIAALQRRILRDFSRQPM